MLRFWPWLAAVLSGVLLVLCFPRWDQAWLVWVALTPVISAIWFGGGGIGRATLLAYVTGLVFFWGVFYWLYTVTGLGCVLLPFYLAIFPASWGALMGLLRPLAGDFTVSWRNFLLAATGAAAWVAQEWVRGWLFTGFGWNGLGTALHGSLWMIQITEYTGIGGLSFLIALANLIAVITVVRFMAEARLRRIRAHWDFSLTMALIAATLAFGIRTVLKPERSEPTTPLKVAMVQPNIPESEKFNFAAEQKIFNQLGFLTESALALNPQLLVWPESATPRSIYASEGNFKFAQDFAKRDDVNFLLGTLDFDEDNGGHDYNVAVLFTNHGKSIQTYRKIHLVPFGEYIPFRHSFPFFAWVIGSLVPVDFTPGTKPLVLKLANPDLKAGALICFEDTLGDLTRQFTKGGAQFLVNVTNDGWFLKSAGAEQHLANAVFRAVENRRPLLRSANTGVTAIVDTLGRVTNELRAPNGTPFTEGVVSDIVQVPPPTARLTFYTRHGDVVAILCSIWALAAIPYCRWRARR